MSLKHTHTHTHTRKHQTSENRHHLQVLQVLYVPDNELKQTNKKKNPLQGTVDTLNPDEHIFVPLQVPRRTWSNSDVVQNQQNE